MFFLCCIVYYGVCYVWLNLTGTDVIFGRHGLGIPCDSAPDENVMQHHLNRLYYTEICVQAGFLLLSLIVLKYYQRKSSVKLGLLVLSIPIFHSARDILTSVTTGVIMSEWLLTGIILFICSYIVAVWVFNVLLQNRANFKAGVITSVVSFTCLYILWQYALLRVMISFIQRLLNN